MAEPTAEPKHVIIEYRMGDDRIYGFGIVKPDGEIEAIEEQTFGSFPGGSFDVSKADGTIVSNEAYLTEMKTWD